MRTSYKNDALMNESVDGDKKKQGWQRNKQWTRRCCLVSCRVIKGNVIFVLLVL